MTNHQRAGRLADHTKMLERIVEINQDKAKTKFSA